MHPLLDNQLKRTFVSTFKKKQHNDLLLSIGKYLNKHLSCNYDGVVSFFILQRGLVVLVSMWCSFWIEMWYQWVAWLRDGKSWKKLRYYKEGGHWHMLVILANTESCNIRWSSVFHQKQKPNTSWALILTIRRKPGNHIQKFLVEHICISYSRHFKHYFVCAYLFLRQSV